MYKLDFINKVVLGYIKKDLENIKIYLPRKESEEGNCNFPIALFILSYMEYLGSFITGNEFGKIKNIKTYLDNCFKNYSEYNADILYDIFRNGLAHDYFARGSVARDGIRPGLYRGWDNKVILDVDTLLEDFLVSLDNFKDNLDEDMIKQRFRFSGEAIKRWEEIHKQSILNLPYIADIRSVRASGASIYPSNITRPYDPNEK